MSQLGEKAYAAYSIVKHHCISQAQALAGYREQINAVDSIFTPIKGEILKKL